MTAILEALLLMTAGFSRLSTAAAVDAAATGHPKAAASAPSSENGQNKASVQSTAQNATVGGAPAVPPSASGAGSEPPVAAKPEPTSFTIENSLMMRDPFRRLVVGDAEAVGATIPELERFDLDKYKLVGVITGPKRARALITAPGGKMHIVSEQTKIGTRRGVIRKIAPGMISIEEKVVNLLGQEESIETVMQFKEKKDSL